MYSYYSMQISDSFKKFGIKDSSQNVLAVLLHDTRECSQVRTTLVAMSVWYQER